MYIYFTSSHFRPNVRMLADSRFTVIALGDSARLSIVLFLFIVTLGTNRLGLSTSSGDSDSMELLEPSRARGGSLSSRALCIVPSSDFLSCEHVSILSSSDIICLCTSFTTSDSLLLSSSLDMGVVYHEYDTTHTYTRLSLSIIIHSEDLSLQ